MRKLALVTTGTLTCIEVPTRVLLGSAGAATSVVPAGIGWELAEDDVAGAASEGAAFTLPLGRSPLGLFGRRFVRARSTDEFRERDLEDLDPDNESFPLPPKRRLRLPLFFDD